MTDQATPEIETLSAPQVLEYPYTRSVGAVIGHFLHGLKEHELAGSEQP